MTKVDRCWQCVMFNQIHYWATVAALIVDAKEDKVNGFAPTKGTEVIVSKEVLLLGYKINAAIDVWVRHISLTGVLTRNSKF